MNIFLFLLFFLFAILIFGLSVIIAIVRAIFGLGRGSSSHSKQATGYENTRQQERHRSYEETDYSSDSEDETFSENNPGSKHPKMFTKDDGEYVEFEEIKE